MRIAALAVVALLGRMGGPDFPSTRITLLRKKPKSGATSTDASLT